MRLKVCVVYNGKYENDSWTVEAVSNTAKYAKDTLFASAYLGLSESDNYFLENVDAKTIKKTISIILDNIDRENDFFIFYFCGHGALDHYNPGHFILGVPEFDMVNPGVLGLHYSDIIDILRRRKIRYYGIIIDTCFAEGANREFLGTNNGSIILKADNDESKGMFLITSTRMNKKTETIEKDGVKHIPFSYYFFETIRKGIDNRFRGITFQEIYDIVKQKLRPHGQDLPEPTLRGSVFSCRIIKNLKYEKTIEHYDNSNNNKDAHRLKVVLVKTAIKHPIKNYDFGIPMGLWVLKAFIKPYNDPVDIEIFDERLELLKETRNGLNISEAEKKVTRLFEETCANSDVVGVSMCTCEVMPGLEKLQKAKSMNKITFVGGIFTASNERYLLETKIVDYVIPGVGALPLKTLLALIATKKNSRSVDYTDEATFDNIAGVATRNNLSEFFIPTVDHLPNMTNDIWLEVVEKYKPFMLNPIDNLYHMDVYSMRGCACACKFCSVQLECGRVPVPRNRKKVIGDINFLYAQGFRYFSLKDDDALSGGYDSTNGFKYFLQQVYKPGIKFKIRTRIDRLMDRPNILEELRSLGVEEIQYGIESSSFIILQSIEKGFSETTVSRVKSFIKRHADIGIVANCSFILGLEGENVGYYEDLSNFIKDLYDYSKNKKCIKPYINFITPHPRDSEFPIDNKWKMITTDLNYFTHKYPVCIATGANSHVSVREKMLNTYEDIISYTNSKWFNPSLKENNYEYYNNVKIGNRYVIKNPKLPEWGGNSNGRS